MNYFERKELKTVPDDATVAKASGLMYKMMCHIKKKIVDQQFQIVRIAGFIKCREKISYMQMKKSDCWIY